MEKLFVVYIMANARPTLYVTIRWEKRKFGVPLSQLQGIKATKETQEAIEDWRYWVAMGYEF